MKKYFFYILTINILIGCGSSSTSNTTDSKTSTTAPGLSTTTQSNYKKTDGSLDVNHYNRIVDNYVKGGNQ